MPLERPAHKVMGGGLQRFGLWMIKMHVVIIDQIVQNPIPSTARQIISTTLSRTTKGIMQHLKPSRMLPIPGIGRNRLEEALIHRQQLHHARLTDGNFP